jgi:hypothetical protein
VRAFFIKCPDCANEETEIGKSFPFKKSEWQEVSQNGTERPKAVFLMNFLRSN